MQKHIIATGFTALAFVFVAADVSAQTKNYPDGHGGEVTFPQGDMSFADQVVHYDTGSDTPVEHARDPENALGIPDYDKSKNRGYASLGCGGELVLKFTDNVLVDVPGSDLYLFEVGPAIEATALAISPDGENWTRVGRIAGGKAEIDIAPYVESDATFRYVRLVDLRAHCGGDTPGADIDAVGAIGSAQSIALSGKVLFDTGQHMLKTKATDAINEALDGVDRQAVKTVAVAGYTDSVGSAEANQALSEQRAQSVAAWLVDGAGFNADDVTSAGHGESQPIASNTTAAGRAENRRVEITLRSTGTVAEADAQEKTTILGLWLAGSKREIELRDKGGVIEGDYTHSAGRIQGRFTDDTTFEGYWIKKRTRHACDEKKDGSRYWGRLRFDFASAERNEFDTQWAYCEKTDWSGTWSHAERIF